MNIQDQFQIPSQFKRLLWAAALLGACIAVSLPAGAQGAACGQDEFAPATKDVGPGAPPMVLGDSVLLLALNDLADAGYNADGQGCRYFDDAIARLRRFKNQIGLPHLVVLALGTDGRVTLAKVKQVLHFLGPSRVLGLVTPHELGGGAGFDATAMRQAANRFPSRIVLLDWVKYSRGHSNWFQPDHAHLSYSGAAAFTRLISKAIHFAPPGRFPNGTVFPH